jgi:hypothetical protein
MDWVAESPARPVKTCSFVMERNFLFQAKGAWTCIREMCYPSAHRVAAGMG